MFRAFLFQYFWIPSEVSTKLPLILHVFTSIYQKIPIDLDYRNYEYNYKFAIVVVEVPVQN